MLKDCLKNTLLTYDFIAFALLFGSFAKGMQHAMSDIDVAIYTNRSIDLFEQGEVIAHLEDLCERRIDLVIVNDLAKTDAKLAFHIVSNHQRLFCHAHTHYVTFKEETYRYYFDQKSMFDMFDQALQQRLTDGTYGKAQAS